MADFDSPQVISTSYVALEQMRKLGIERGSLVLEAASQYQGGWRPVYLNDSTPVEISPHQIIQVQVQHEPTSKDEVGNRYKASSLFILRDPDNQHKYLAIMPENDSDCRAFEVDASRPVFIIARRAVYPNPPRFRPYTLQSINQNISDIHPAVGNPAFTLTVNPKTSVLEIRGHDLGARDKHIDWRAVPMLSRVSG